MGLAPWGSDRFLLEEAFHTYYSRSKRHYSRSKRPREYVMEHAYLGRCYGDGEVAAAVAGFRGGPELDRPDDLCGRAASS